MRQILTIFLLITLLNNCNLASSKVNFRVTNQSKESIRHIEISNGVDAPIVIENLASDSTQNLVMDFYNSEATTDGAYSIEIDHLKDSLHFQIFGYYSNGAPIVDGESYEINITEEKINITDTTPPN